MKLATKNLLGLAFIALGTLTAQPVWAQYKASYTVVKSLDSIEVKANGEYGQISERLFRVETPQGVKELGENRIDYNEKLEELEILDAYTLLPDGTRIDVSADKIRRQDGDGSEEYSDGKSMVIIYPKVDVGSMLYYRYRSYQRTPYFPGHFLWSEYYSPHVAYENVEVELLRAPDVTLQFDADRVQGGQVENRIGDAPGSVRYRFTFNQNQAYPPELGQLAPTDFAPHLAFTTFANYAELANAYQVRAKPMATVTPAIAELAKSLTAGAKDDLTKVRRLYNWVSQNIRYVAVYVAEGGFVPHSAQSILDNRYGDCKDHVTLLEALLSAVGIESTTALINSGDALRLPKLAISTPINHAINYVPSLDLYLDSTSRFSPMGSLPDSETAKPTLLTATGTVGMTPKNSWQKDYDYTKITMELKRDGSITGRSVSIPSGVEEISARAKQFSYKNRDPQEYVGNLLARSQESGGGEFLENDPTNLDMPFKVESIFTLDPVVNIPGPSAMRLPYGLVPGYLRRLASFNPPRNRNFPAQCGSRAYRESMTLKLPRGVAIERKPQDVDSINGAYRYSAKYKVSGNALQVERNFASKRDTPFCTPKDDKDWNAFKAVLQRDLRAQIFLN